LHATIEFALSARDARERRGIRTPLILALAAALSGLLWVTLPAVAVADVRYASPTGTTDPSTCPESAPCELANALGFAQDGDEVIVLPGDYVNAGGGGYSIDSSLYVHSRPGEPVPRIHGGSSSVAIIVRDASTVQRLRLLGQSQSGLRIEGPWANGSLIEQVVAESENYYACDLQDTGDVTLRSTACLSEGDGYTALNIANDRQDGTVTLRNVTARSTGVGSSGILAQTAGTPEAPQLVVDARNVVADGPAADVAGDAQGAPASSVTVNLTSSNYASEEELNGAQITDPGTNGNQTAAPLLAPDGYHQLIGSPTINGGKTDSLIGTLDVDGEARVSGSAPDIGADEVQEAAPSTPAVGSCKGRAATVAAAAPGDVTVGTLGPDVIVGTAGVDTIRSLGGRDLICARGGRDVVSTGAGADVALGEGGNDRLFGQAGSDALSGGRGADQISGATGNDSLGGGLGRDRLAGAAGNDRLLGGAAPDVLIGAGGRDVLRGGAGSDRLIGGAGIDDLSGGPGADKEDP
jgi:hypothetical protein